MELLLQLPDLNRRFTPQVVLLSLLAQQRYEAIQQWSEKIAGGEWSLETEEAQDDEESQQIASPDETPLLQRQLKAARS
jgi:hypothetical protein